MPRIRTIKPEFWTDEKIISLPYVVRLFFIGLWNFADDFGAIKDNPSQLKILILPSEERVDIHQMIDLLISADLLERYIDEENDRSYLVIKSWGSHQKVDKPTKSRIISERAKKAAIPQQVRRDIAIKYRCKPGGQATNECYFCGEKGNIYWSKRSDGSPSGWVSFSHDISHLIPESKGGETDTPNLVLACTNCNRSMGVRIAFDWLINGKYYSNHERESINHFRERSRVFEGSRDGKERKGEDRKGEYTPNGVPDLKKSETMPFVDYSSIAKTKEDIYAFLKSKPVDIDPYVDFWNLFAIEKGLPKVKTINDNRRRKLKIRLSEPDFNLPEILRKAGKSEFLMSGKWFGFDWIIENNSHYIRVIEGNYDNKADTNQPTNDQKTVSGRISKELLPNG